jgi:hypothetical protein
MYLRSVVQAGSGYDYTLVGSWETKIGASGMVVEGAEWSELDHVVGG